MEQKYTRNRRKKSCSLHHAFPEDRKLFQLTLAIASENKKESAGQWQQDIRRNQFFGKKRSKSGEEESIVAATASRIIIDYITMTWTGRKALVGRPTRISTPSIRTGQNWSWLRTSRSATKWPSVRTPRNISTSLFLIIGGAASCPLPSWSSRQWLRRC